MRFMSRKLALDQSASRKIARRKVCVRRIETWVQLRKLRRKVSRALHRRYDPILADRQPLGTECPVSLPRSDREHVHAGFQLRPISRLQLDYLGIGGHHDRLLAAAVL